MDVATTTAQTPSSLPANLSHLLNGQTAYMQAHLKYDGLKFSRSSTHLGNSLVMFYPNGNRSLSPVPGQIEHIIIKAGQPMFALKRHLPMSQAVADPFRFYEHLRMKVYSSQFTDVLELVDVEWVTGHFAQYLVTSAHVVVMSLSRVSVFIFAQSSF